LKVNCEVAMVRGIVFGHICRPRQKQKEDLTLFGGGRGRDGRGDE